MTSKALLERRAADHCQRRGPLTRAVGLLGRGAELGDGFGQNDAAWLLASCSSATADLRHAAALIEAGLAHEGDRWERVDTLAAVQARLGKHGAAQLTQRRALELLARRIDLTAADVGWYATDPQARLADYLAARGPSVVASCPTPRARAGSGLRPAAPACRWWYPTPARAGPWRSPRSGTR